MKWIKKLNIRGDDGHTGVQGPKGNPSTVPGPRGPVGPPGSAGIPSGGIIMYSGLISAIPHDWLLCDGKHNTPDMTGKFIRGTTHDANMKNTGGSADSVVVPHIHQVAAHSHTIAHTHAFTTGNESASHHHAGKTGGEDTKHSHDVSRFEGHTIHEGATTGTKVEVAMGMNHGGRIIATTEEINHHSHPFTTGNETTHHRHSGTTGGSSAASTGGKPLTTGGASNAVASGVGQNLPPYIVLAYIMKK